MPRLGADGRAGITATLVRKLLKAQFPHLSRLPITPVAADGWDNRTYRLGESMSVRLPTAIGYAPAVAKENEWLPRLAPFLPLAIPTILGFGQPNEEYPYQWSIREWQPGETADIAYVQDLPGFAICLVTFICALQGCDIAGAPAAGAHSWFRGASLRHYDRETRECLVAAKGKIDTDLAARVWDAALSSEWTGSPVWFHGDMTPANLIVDKGKLSAVIDFGTCGVGDPSCDLAITWTMFAGKSREAFRGAIGQDPATWARARGWALWKSLLLLTSAKEHSQALTARRTIAEILADHVSSLALENHAT